MLCLGPRLSVPWCAPAALPPTPARLAQLEGAAGLVLRLRGSGERRVALSGGHHLGLLMIQDFSHLGVKVLVKAERAVICLPTEAMGISPS